MTEEISKSDVKLLLFIAEFKFLTAIQLGSLSQRSRQVSPIPPTYYLLRWCLGYCLIGQYEDAIK